MDGIESDSASAVQGQAVFLGMRDGSNIGVGVCRRPWRRPVSADPSAMVDAHRVVSWSWRTIVIPT